MCGRFALTAKSELIKQLFDIEGEWIIEAQYNISPSSNIICIQNSKEQQELIKLRWGLIPHWAKNMKRSMINARIESLYIKPIFKKLVQSQRCCILASGFYEWQKLDDQKQPYYITLPSGNPFAMAGIWSTWKNEQGELLKTCAIITKPANASFHEIHDRMPLILKSDSMKVWLTDNLMNEGVLHQLGRDNIDLNFYAVSSWVNNPRHDSAECIVPLDSNFTK